jgi:hypothetical protein
MEAQKDRLASLKNPSLSEAGGFLNEVHTLKKTKHLIKHEK